MTASFGPTSTRRGGILAGCLVVILIVLLLAGIGVYWVSTNWRGWTSDAARQALIQQIEDSPLPEAQKTAIRAEIDEFTQDFKDGNISVAQVGKVIEEIAESPLLHVGAVYYVDREYIATSELNDEEKAEARLAVHRFARGVHEESIPVQKVDDVLAPISELDEDGDQSLKDTVTREELEAFVALAKEHADAAEVPNEVFEVDIAAEISKAIDRALGRTTAETSLPPETPDDSDADDAADADSDEPATTDEP